MQQSESHLITLRVYQLAQRPGFYDVEVRDCCCWLIGYIVSVNM